MSYDEIIEMIEDGDMDMVEAFEFIEDETDLDSTQVINELFY